MSQALQAIRMRFSTMACPAELCVYACSATEARTALLVAVRESSRLDRKYSHYREDSDLAILQHNASQPGGKRVDGETAALLNFAACQFQQSDGRFDITAGHLTHLWEQAPQIPSGPEIAAALSMTGWHRVAWDGHTLILPAGMHLNLGAIVKEYAADRIVLLLRRQGFDSGYVDLGGDLHFIGPHPDGRPWQVGIRHPRAVGTVAGIGVSRGGLATSGDYERFRLYVGRRYSHILDARSGWPVAGLASVSVLAPCCLLAGAASTLAMLLDKDEAIEWLAESGLCWLAHDGTNGTNGVGSNFKNFH
jgi:thiamine biosynthesis lipoprotein